MIFETHAHYDDEKFDEDRAELLSSMQETGSGVSSMSRQIWNHWKIQEN